jgi:Ca2+/Na+ antiporter
VAPTLIVPAVALIIGGSVGVVRAAIALAAAWDVPAPVVGTLVLAGLTSLPNAYAAVRLARRGRGAALVSESFNSSTINLAVGVALPVAVLGLGGAPGGATPDLPWLLVLTLVALGWLARPGGLSRRGGWVLMGLYAAFVLIRIT